MACTVLRGRVGGRGIETGMLRAVHTALPTHARTRESTSSSSSEPEPLVLLGRFAGTVDGVGRLDGVPGGAGLEE